MTEENPAQAGDGEAEARSATAQAPTEAAPPEASAAADGGDAAAAPPPDPLEEARAEAARYRDQLLRTAADFDNFRKRTRRELTEAELRGREDVLKDLLPVFDNLERAMAHADSTTGIQALQDGLRMVHKQFLDTLGKLGIERVQSIGHPFDPAVHEAIQHLESPEHPAGVVMAEVQAGYRKGDRLLRPAMVVVSKGTPRPAEPPEAASPAEPGGPGDPADGAG